MPLYDCGNTECTECVREFGPDRSKAIADYQRRDALYAGMSRAATLRTMSTARHAQSVAIKEMEAG